MEKTKETSTSITILASTFKKDLSLLENYISHKEGINALGNFGLKPKTIVGCYWEEEELSLSFSLSFFLKEGKSFIESLFLSKTFSLVSSLFFDRFNQESILLIDENGNSFLLYSNGDYESLGLFVKVSKEIALKNKCCSYIDGEFFICLGEDRPFYHLSKTLNDFYLEAEKEI